MDLAGDGEDARILPVMQGATLLMAVIDAEDQRPLRPGVVRLARTRRLRQDLERRHTLGALSDANPSDPF